MDSSLGDTARDMSPSGVFIDEIESLVRKTEERNNVYIDQRPDKIFKTIRLPVDVETDAQYTAKYDINMFVLLFF